MSRAIEEFGFRLSLGIQEVDAFLTVDEIAEVERLAKAFKVRKKEHRRARIHGLEWLRSIPDHAGVFNPTPEMKPDFTRVMKSRGIDWADVELEKERRSKL